MLRIDNIKISAMEDNLEDRLRERAAMVLRIKASDIVELKILKRSIDARKKPEVFWIFRVAVRVNDHLNEKQLMRSCRMKDVSLYEEKSYKIEYDFSGADTGRRRPVVIGAGPAGLFAAYRLCLSGMTPVLIERGKSAAERREDVERFFATGVLDTSSNVQFGEGGAGTFSDGKLNTGVKDKTGRNQFVADTFIRFGAPEEIAYDSHPHIGTDLLIGVVTNLRKEIERLGGEVHFGTCMKELLITDGRVSGVRCESSEGEKVFEADDVILAIGHSARDTFFTLYDEHIPMISKQFAVGFRIEHPQDFMNIHQYGEKVYQKLPAVSYKLAHTFDDGRGIYSFCMCPGGYVVNASSEKNRLCVNGMSNFRRDSGNANSAIVISVGKDEYDINDPLGAISYQRSLEEKAFKLAGGAIPQQLFGDFRAGKISSSYGDFGSMTKGEASFADLREIFTPQMNEAFLKGMEIFDTKISGFARYDAILSGVEARTSSPVRITRDENLESTGLRGLYPCGEGAGYAGGITSAAIDGIKCAEALMKNIELDQKKDTFNG